VEKDSLFWISFKFKISPEFALDTSMWRFEVPVLLCLVVLLCSVSLSCL
jgi:hypothetical protein